MCYPKLCACVAVTLLFNGATADDKELTAKKLFDVSHVVDVSIDLPAADWDAVRFQSRSFTKSLTKGPPDSPFKYAKADITIDGVRLKNVGVRKKGFLGSLDDERPSLKIRFDKYVDQTPIAGIDRLTLNNNKQDPSGLSQLMGYQFFNRSGTIAPRCNHAKVTVNGKYLGIYSNVESIRAPMLEQRFGSGDSALFEGTVVDFLPDYIDGFERKNKAADNSRMIDRVSEILNKEELDLEALEKLVDLPAFVRFWATESLLGFWDGYTNDQNNFYIYQHPASSKLHFIPWGADALFQEGMPIPPYFIRPRFVHSQSLLANRLYRIPEVQELYHTTMKELLETQWNESKLLAEVDVIEARIKSLVRDENKLFGKTVERIRKFIKERREKLEDEMQDGPVKLAAKAKQPAYFKSVGDVTITFETKWFDKTPDDTQSIGSVRIKLLKDGKEVEFQSLGAYAEHSKWAPVPEGIPKPPAIIFSGKSEPKGRSMLLGVGLPIRNFQPTNGKPVNIDGILFNGPVGWPTTETKMLTGEAVFDKAAMKDGATVKGKMKLSIRQMSGGKPID